MTMPETAPIITASTEETAKQDAVIPTNPARIPLRQKLMFIYL